MEEDKKQFSAYERINTRLKGSLAEYVAFITGEQGLYDNTSEYIRDLIRRDMEVRGFASPTSPYVLSDVLFNRAAADSRTGALQKELLATGAPIYGIDPDHPDVITKRHPDGALERGVYDGTDFRSKTD